MRFPAEDSINLQHCRLVLNVAQRWQRWPRRDKGEIRASMTSWKLPAFQVRNLIFNHVKQHLGV
jgi:hypothetical protein